jgi:hypothetical protein
MNECSAFIEGKAAQFAASVRGVLVVLCAVWALRRLPAAVLDALARVPWRVRVALPLALLVLNVAIVLERTAEDTVLWLADTTENGSSGGSGSGFASVLLSVLGVGVLGGLGSIVQRSWDRLR